MKFLIKNGKIFLFYLLLLIIKGEKISINIKSNFPMHLIRINPDNENISFNYKDINEVLFNLEYQQGKNILFDISSNKKIIDAKNLNFSLKFEEGNITYFFDKKNISLIKKKQNQILIKFHIPYKIYFNSHDNITFNDSNAIINVNRRYNIKNNKNKRMKINDNDTYLNDSILYKNRKMNSKQLKMNKLNKIYKKNTKNKRSSNNTLILKYKGFDYISKEQTKKQSLLKIKKKNKRQLEIDGNSDSGGSGSGETGSSPTGDGSTGSGETGSALTENEYFYIFGEIFDNEEAYENMDDIVEFLNNDINVFDIKENFFQDICYHYERNHHDYVLTDRIEFFYQNYSICGEAVDRTCNLTKIYFENYSYCCICLPVLETEENGHKKKTHSMELDESFSMERVSQAMGNLFFESNLSVIQCFFVLLKEKLFLTNFGFLTPGVLLLIQIFASFFLYSHMNEIRLFVFRDLIKCKYNPPLKRGKTMRQSQDNLVSESTNLKRINTRNTNSIMITNTKTNRNEKTKKFGTELTSVKGMIPINTKNNEVKEIMNNGDIYNSNNDLNVYTINKNSRKFNSKRMSNFNDSNSNMKLKDSTASSRKFIKNNLGMLSSKDNFFDNNNIEIYRKDTQKKDDEEEGDNNNDSNVSYDQKSYNINENNEKIDNTDSVIQSDKASQYSENEEKEKDKDLVYPYEKKDYDEDDLDGLDYDEALVYDKRTFCQLFHKQLLERQLIANTFCVKDNLKPFSIKVIVLLFTISCYLVINGFLFNEEYVMKILRRKSKGFYYFLVDSTTRIVYSSIIGGVINIIVGLLFRADKQLRKVQSKYEDNKIILHGEIVKIYKSTRSLYIIFTIFNICCMLIFIFYLFCFCGVYRNCQADWFEGCFIVLFIMQLVPVIVSAFLAVMRKAGLICKIEFFFKINSWIIENL